MANFERDEGVPAGQTVILRASPLVDSVTQVQIYEGGSPTVAGSGTLVTTITLVGQEDGEFFVSWRSPAGQTPGQYFDDWTFVTNNVTEPVARLSGFSVLAATVLASGPAPAVAHYPFPFGYCQMADVQARILAGQWDPTNSNDGPDPAQVNAWIQQQAAMIDSVLLRRGYTVPLTVLPSFPGGKIMPQVYFMLRDINAALVSYYVEQARHGSSDKNGDLNAEAHLHYADDLLARIETGAENLALYGVAGPFEPVADAAKGIQLGSSTDPTTMQPTEPFFTRNMDFG